MTSQLARDLVAIAHQHYVTPDTLDQGFGDGLVERMQEKLKQVLFAMDFAHESLMELRSGDRGSGWRERADNAIAALERLSELRKAVET